MIRHFTIVTIAAAVALLLASSPVLPCDAGDVHVDPFFCAQWGFPPNDTECIRHALTLLPPISNNNTVNTVYLASFTAWNGRCEFVLPARTQLTGNLISPNAVHIYCSNSTCARAVCCRTLLVVDVFVGQHGNKIALAAFFFHPPIYVSLFIGGLLRLENATQ